MKIAEYYNLDLLKRESETLVFERIGRLLDERSDFCKCEQCILDLVAYVLNNVSPLYGASLIGSLDPHQAKIKRVKGEIEVAIREGLKKVSKNPNHEVSQ